MQHSFVCSKYTTSSFHQVIPNSIMIFLFLSFKTYHFMHNFNLMPLKNWTFLNNLHRPTSHIWIRKSYTCTTVSWFTISLKRSICEATYFHRSPTSGRSCSHRLWHTRVFHLPFRQQYIPHILSPEKGRGSDTAHHLQFLLGLLKLKTQTPKS